MLAFLKAQAGTGRASETLRDGGDGDWSTDSKHAIADTSTWPHLDLRTHARSHTGSKGARTRTARTANATTAAPGYSQTQGAARVAQQRVVWIHAQPRSRSRARPSRALASRACSSAVICIRCGPHGTQSRVLDFIDRIKAARVVSRARGGGALRAKGGGGRERGDGWEARARAAGAHLVTGHQSTEA